MRTIKIGIDKPGTNEKTMKHIATNWQISRLPDFSKREYMLFESLNDSERLLELRENIGVDEHDSLYVRTKFIFDNNRESEWSDIVPLTGERIGIKLSGVVIATPQVTIDIDYELSSVGVVTVNCSEFQLFSGVGKHEATDWSLFTLDGEIIYQRFDDDENLTSLVLPQDQLKDNTAYIVKVRYISNNHSTKSNYGKTFLTTYVEKNDLYTLNFPFGLLPNNKFYGNLQLYINNFKSLDIIIRDETGKVVAEELGQVTKTPFINTGDLKEYRHYSIESRAKLLTGEYTAYTKHEIKLVTKNELVVKDKAHKYLGKYTSSQELILNGATVQSVMQHRNGDILLTKNGVSDITRYEFRNKRLIETNDKLELGDMDSLDMSYLNIIPLYNGDIMVDYSTKNVEGVSRKPVFKLFELNPITKKYIKSKQKIRENERYSTSISTSAVSGSDGLYYVPNEIYDSEDKLTYLKLMKYDYEENKIEVVSDLPFDAKRFVTLVTVDETNILVLGGSRTHKVVKHIDLWTRDNNKVYNFNTVTKKWTLLFELPGSVDESIYAFQAFMRKDKKVAVFNAVYSGPSIGKQNTFILDLEQKTCVVENNDQPDNAIYRNIVMLQNGDILRISSTVLDPQKVNTYISDTYSPEDIIDTQIVDLVTDLVIGRNQVVETESLYRFSSIKIEGDDYKNSGVLRWLDGEEVTEFRHDDLIVTRDMVIVQNLYEGVKEFNSITILEDAALDIQNIIKLPDGVTWHIQAPFDVTDIILGEDAELIIDEEE